jgi:solute carrier family 35, member E1
MVPHVTTAFDRRGSSSTHTTTPTTYPFPDFASQIPEEDGGGVISRGPSPRPLPNGLPPGLHSSERWPIKKQSKPGSWASWMNGSQRVTRHGRQKSLSEAIHTVRTRKASISENAHEIAESLKAPVSYKLVILCNIWFAASILTNTSSKAILTSFSKPITLTIMQFLLVSFWCIFASWLAKRNASVRNALPVLKNGIRKPNKEIIVTTLPLVAFQIGGHILNSEAMSKIPVSLVHTIKGLSPLMTVFAYRTFYDHRYPLSIYLSLIPLTVGVVMACSASFKGNFTGLLYAFGSAILFVTQNIVSKKIFNEAAKAEADGTPAGRRKPDKLNLLCYSSAIALILTFPIWLWSEGTDLMRDYLHDGSIDLRDRPGALDHGRLTLEFLFNGTFHFGQSLVAFVLLGMVSPVTYSVASLIKRVAVIIFAIVWFHNPMTRIQGAGFILTFLGLYLYDRTSDSAKADKRAREMGESSAPLLPINASDAWKNNSVVVTDSPISADGLGKGFMAGSSYANGEPVGSGPGRPNAYANGAPNGVPIPLAPGTKAEDTWAQVGVGRHEAVR